MGTIFVFIYINGGISLVCISLSNQSLLSVVFLSLSSYMPYIPYIGAKNLSTLLRYPNNANDSSLRIYCPYRLAFTVCLYLGRRLLSIYPYYLV